MKTKLTFAYLISMLFLALSACKKEDSPIEGTNKFKIAEATLSGDTKVILWADQATLSVAYTPLYLTVEGGSGRITNSNITIHPEMDMHTMSHSSPTEQPVYNPTTGLYIGAVVFTMPSGDMGTWKLTIDVDDQSVDIPLTINPPATGTKLVGSYMGSDDVRYTVSLVQPLVPKIGINDLEILVNRSGHGHGFPPVEDLQIEFEPEMPSMGHGSPNNVNPVHTGNGRYKGKVNFSMSGDWRLNITLKKGETVLVDNATLDLVF